MLFPSATLTAIADGRIDLAFRRWRRPTVKAGTLLRTPVGVIEILAVDAIDEASITERESRRAGHATHDGLAASLARAPGGRLYRIAFRFAGADPRLALRERVPRTGAERDVLLSRIAAVERRRGSPFVGDLLRLIGARPAVRAADLAASIGRETQAFKADVRRLKEMGLTESLDVGYRLSPRGQAVLAILERRLDAATA